MDEVLDDELAKEAAEQLAEEVDPFIKERVEDVASKEVADKVETQVHKRRLERELFGGKDLTGLSKDQKEALTSDFRGIATGTKEKGAILESSDQAGGYLVPSEVFEGILRISATTGLVARDAQQFDMSKSEFDVPTYTGSDLLGSYVGEDSEGDETDIDFDNSKLDTEKWMVLLRASNDMLADSAVDLADWLMNLVAEGRAARLDKEGFQGGTYSGSPFVGILGSDDVTTYNLGGSNSSGSTTVGDFDPITDGAEITAQVETSVAQGAAFYMHRTNWAEILKATDSNDSPIVGVNEGAILQNQPRQGIQPSGVLQGYPVYTSDYLPDNASVGSDDKFAVFGNLNDALLVGNRTDGMSVMEADQGSVGGRNLIESDQRALRFTDRHAVSVGLPSAAVAIETANS